MYRSNEISVAMIDMSATILSLLFSFDNDSLYGRDWKLDVKYESYIPLLNVIDNLLEAMLINRNTTSFISDPLTSIRSSLMNISNSILRDFLLGQSNMEFINHYYRSTAFIEYSDNSTVFTINSPLSEFEKYINFSIPVITISQDVIDTKNQLIASITYLHDQIYTESNDKLLGQSILFSLSDRSTQCIDNNCRFQTTFNHSYINYTTNMVVSEDTPPTIFCTWGQPLNTTLPCSNGYEVSIECNGEFDGFINATCPYDTTVPICTEVNSNNHNLLLESELCSTYDFGPTWITCECAVNVHTTSIDWSNPSVTSLELVPVTRFLHIPQSIKVTQNPYPTMPPTPVPTVGLSYPTITFCLEANVTFLMKYYGSMQFTSNDMNAFVHATSLMFTHAKSANVIAKDISLDSSSISTVNSNNANNYKNTTMQEKLRTMNFVITLTSDLYCTADEAFKVFSSNFGESLAISSWSNAVNDIGLKDKVISVVYADFYSPISCGIISIIQTSSMLCNSSPTLAPVSNSNTNNIDSTSTHSQKESVMSITEFIKMYLTGFISFILVTILYICYSNRIKRLFNFVTKGRKKKIILKDNLETSFFEDSLHSSVISAVDEDSMEYEFVNAYYENDKMINNSAFNWNKSDDPNEIDLSVVGDDDNNGYERITDNDINVALNDSTFSPSICSTDNADVASEDISRNIANSKLKSRKLKRSSKSRKAKRALNLAPLNIMGTLRDDAISVDDSSKAVVKSKADRSLKLVPLISGKNDRNDDDSVVSKDITKVSVKSKADRSLKLVQLISGKSDHNDDESVISEDVTKVSVKSKADRSLKLVPLTSGKSDHNDDESVISKDITKVSVKSKADRSLKLVPLISGKSDHNDDESVVSEDVTKVSVKSKADRSLKLVPLINRKSDHNDDESVVSDKVSVKSKTDQSLKLASLISTKNKSDESANSENEDYQVFSDEDFEFV
jgi:hypothetical protein